MLLYLDDTAKCISKAMCMFGKPNGVACKTYSYILRYYTGQFDVQYVCLSRQDTLDKHPEYYIDIELYAYNYRYCPDPAVVDNRICACPGGTYFDGYDYSSSPTRTRCPYLPDIFDRSHLKLDINYTYNDKEYV